MRTLLRLLPIIALLAAPLQVFGGTQATMQVSFTIVASCSVDGHGATAPAVICGQTVGYIVAPANNAGVTSGSDAAGWTVYF